jgi:hypothetical protein
MEDVDSADGGYLSGAARQAGVRSAIHLVGRYFSGGTQPLASQQAVGAADGQESDASDEVLAGIRVRVALAAASRLLDIVESIERRPNFRYELVSADEVGSITGQFDVQRWLSQRSTIVEELTYPTLQSTRSSRTAENILVAFALAWMQKELRSATRVSTAGIETVEAKAATLLAHQLKTMADRPTYAQCTNQAANLRSDRAVLTVAQQVQRRAQRRVMRNSTPYAELAAWVVQTIGGEPAVDAGEIEWAFYGQQFDRTLFELWCLHHLMRALARRLGQTEPQVEPGWSQSGVTYRFRHFAGEVDLYYQTSWSTITGSQGRWVRHAAAPLGGRPDIVVRVTPTGGSTTYVILDPKLRQRTQLPTEEIYKLLGYFENFAVHPRRGAILFYSTRDGALQQYKLHAGAGEEIAAIQLNPASSLDGVAGLELAVDLVLSALAMDIPSFGEDQGDGDDDATAEQSVSRIRRSLISWADSHEVDLKSDMNTLEALLTNARWTALPTDVQKMLATAMHTGSRQPDHSDYSGPIIGLCAALEDMLYRGAIEPLIHAQPKHENNLRMLGQIIAALEGATLDASTNRQTTTMQQDLRLILEDRAIDRSDVAALVPRWRKVNQDLRRPAAHRHPMSREQWHGACESLISAALLADTFDVLGIGGSPR